MALTATQKLFALAALGSVYQATNEVDPEWLYWLLALVCTVVTGLVELQRSRHANPSAPTQSDLMALSVRVGVIETLAITQDQWAAHEARILTLEASETQDDEA